MVDMFRSPLVMLLRVVTIGGPKGGLLVAVGVWAAGCGTASRPLPSRQVDDPVTLPRRMLSLSLGARGTLSNEDREREGHEVPLRIRYGITDRITIEDLLVLDAAV